MSGFLGVAQSALAGAIGVVVGGVSCTGIELPEKMSWGGTQALAKQVLPGGTVIVSAMGLQYKPISWSGIFEGQFALLRSSMLYAMMDAANQVLLNWNDRVYTVVVSEYHADDTKTNWIPYSVTCEVIRDEALPLLEAVTDFIGSVEGDIADAIGIDPGGIAGGLALNAAAVAVSVAGSTIFGTSANQTAANAVSAGRTSVQTATTANDADLAQIQASAAANAPPGRPAVFPATNGPASIANALAATQGAALASIQRGLVARAATNLANGST